MDSGTLAAQLGDLDIDRDCIESLQWLETPSSSRDLITKSQLCAWLRTGPVETDTTIRPYDYCEASIVDDLVQAHQQQAAYTDDEKIQASRRMNRYEAIGRHFFSTRTAMKLANVDALFKFSALPPSADPDETLTYADITNSDDSGVIEYMQWRKGQHCRGYAFDVRQRLWRNVLREKQPTSELHREVSGSDSDPDTARRFIAFVREHEPEGVYLAYSEHMLQPNGEHFDRSIAIRESWCKTQVLRNCALSLALLRPNGSAVVKIMETFTPFTMGLIYLLRMCFGQMAIVKMRTSRLTSGERYLLLRERIADNDFVQMMSEHLLCTSASSIQMGASGESDLFEMVPAERLSADDDAKAFIAYMRQTIVRIAVAQTQALRKRFDEILRPSRHIDEHRKLTIRDACYREWNVPDFDDMMRPDVFVAKLAKHVKPYYGVNRHMSLLQTAVEEYSSSNQSQQSYSSFRRPLNGWYFAPLANPSTPTFFCYMGENRLIMWSAERRWEPVELGDVGLPTGTLLYGEMCPMYSQEGTGPSVTMHEESVLHIIDLLCLHFEPLQHLSIWERRRRLSDFAKAANVKVYVRPLYPIAELLTFVRSAKGLGSWKTIPNSDTKSLMFRANDMWYLAGGIGFLLEGRFGAFPERPLLWDWRNETGALLDQPLDEPEYFSWFEKRLASLPSQRAQFANNRGSRGQFANNRGTRGQFANNRGTQASWGIYRSTSNHQQ